MRYLRIRLFTTAALVACAALSSIAHAQTPGQGGGTSPIPLNPAAPKGEFHGSLTAGVSIETGRTDLTGTQILFNGQQSFSSTGIFTTALSYTHATTLPPGRSSRITVANRLDAGFGIEQNVRKHGIMMLRSQVLRDPIARIDYRFEELVGFGLRTAGKRAEFRAVPGLAFLWDDKNIAAEEGHHTHYGFYQDFRAQLSPTFMFLQTAAASRNFVNAKDYIVSFDARLLGMITKMIGVQISYTFNLESILPPGVDHEYAKTMAGVQIRF